MQTQINIQVIIHDWVIGALRAGLADVLLDEVELADHERVLDAGAHLLALARQQHLVDVLQHLLLDAHFEEVVQLVHYLPLDGVVLHDEVDVLDLAVRFMAHLLANLLQVFEICQLASDAVEEERNGNGA